MTLRVLGAILTLIKSRTDVAQSPSSELVQDCVMHAVTLFRTQRALKSVRLGTRNVSAVSTVGGCDMSTEYVPFCTRSAALAMRMHVLRFRSRNSDLGFKHASAQFLVPERVWQSLGAKLRSSVSRWDESRTKSWSCTGIAWKYGIARKLGGSVGQS